MQRYKEREYKVGEKAVFCFLKGALSFLFAKLAEKFHTHLTEKLSYPHLTPSIPQFPITFENLF